MDNKSQSGIGAIVQIFLYIMFFGVLSVIIVGAGYFMYAIGNDYTVLPLYNASLAFNDSAAITAGFENTVIFYQGIDLGFIDNMFFFAYALLVVISFALAYSVKSPNYFSFLAMLTYGMMFILFIAGLFGVVLEFLYNDILQNLFLNLAINVPFLAYYVANYGFLFLIHSGLLLLVTMIDIDLAFITGRKKKEVAAIDEII